MGEITVVLGGTRSGKSRYALARARELGGDRVTFVATARPGDPDLDERIAGHRRVRPTTWRTLETDTDLAKTLALVRDLRLPRVVGAALIGGALAVAGTLLQGLLRNPLADPYVTGTSAGASLGAVATIAIGATAPFVLPFGAFAGAILAVA